MTSIPLFEALQNEMHRKMGCPHIGCFNEASATFKKTTKPSTWSGGLYGHLCEGNSRIDPDFIRVIYRLQKATRNGADKPAAEKGQGLLDLDELNAVAMFGNGVSDATQLAIDIRNYLDAAPAEKEALEQVCQHIWSFDDVGIKRFLEVLSRMQRGEFDPATTRNLIHGISRGYRTGSDGFYDEETGDMVFPEELWRDPENYRWDDTDSYQSHSVAGIEDLGFNKEDEYK